MFQNNQTGTDMCAWRLAALEETLGCLIKTGVVGGYKRVREGYLKEARTGRPLSG